MSQRPTHKPPPPIAPTPKAMIARWILLVLILLAIPAVGFAWIIQNQSNSNPATPAQPEPTPEEASEAQTESP